MIPEILSRLAPLRTAFFRSDTFVWFVLFILAMSCRRDTAGVTSMVRALSLKPAAYHAFLGMLASPAVDAQELTSAWVTTVLAMHEKTTVRVNGRHVLLGDGLKVPKEARKMPGVKALHQESNNNSKPPWVMAHSFQVLALLVGDPKGTTFATPLTSRIHEGVKLTNRDKRTLQEKFCIMTHDTWPTLPAYLVADSYYSCGYMARFLVEDLDIHLVTRADTSAVAYRIPETDAKKRRGRKRKYGVKVKLKEGFTTRRMTDIPSPVYRDERTKLRYWLEDLIWKPYGGIVRFVGVDYPGHGRLILMTTDLTLSAVDIIRLYGFRMKIEVSFKAAVHDVGTYAYHHWTQVMPPLRRGQGTQHLHHRPKEERERIVAKLKQCERHVQCGVIAQGLLQHLAVNHTKEVWGQFRGWLRTIRPGLLPSEGVTLVAMQSEYREFLLGLRGESGVEKMLLEMLDTEQLDNIELLQMRS